MTQVYIPWKEVGGPECEHYDYSRCKDYYPTAARFTVVRNPFDWYASFWAYRQMHGWGGDFALGHACEADTFDGFIAKCYKNYPGWLHSFYNQFTRPGVVVLKTEDLAAGVVEYLDSRGEVFNKEELAKVEPANQAGSVEPYKGQTGYTQEMAQLLALSEARLFEQFNYSINSYKKAIQQ